MAGNVWATDSLGGFLSARHLSRVLRHEVQPLIKFRQFADIKDASQQGKKKGDLFTWDRFSKVATAGGILTETNTMPETNFTIQQGTLTITELGNSVPYTGKLDNLSELPVTEIIQKALKDDVVKALDREAFNQFNQTPLRVVATTTSSLTLTTNGSATATNSIAFRKEHAKLLTDMMKERNIPAFVGDDYYAIAWPSTYRSFKNDLESIHQYTDPGFALIKNGEIGRYENTRYVEQTYIAKGRTTDKGLTGSAWTNSLSDWVFVFGQDTVAEAVAVPEELRGKIPSDYGRSKGIAWYYLGGFGLVHSDALNARIVKWDSAS